MKGVHRIGSSILEGSFRVRGVAIRLGQARPFRARPCSRTETRAGPSCEELQDAYYSSRVHGGTSTERFFPVDEAPQGAVAPCLCVKLGSHMVAPAQVGLPGALIRRPAVNTVLLPYRLLRQFSLRSRRVACFRIGLR